jgi:hypothetical protein
MTLLRECGTTKLLRECGTAKLLRACPIVWTGIPCDSCPNGTPSKLSVSITGWSGYCLLKWFPPDHYAWKVENLPATYNGTLVQESACTWSVALGTYNLSTYIPFSSCPDGTPSSTWGQSMKLRIYWLVGSGWLMEIYEPYPGGSDVFWTKSLGSFSCIAPLTVDTGNGVVSIVPLP